MDLGVPPLRINLLEPNPLKSRFLVRELTVPLEADQSSPSPKGGPEYDVTGT